MLWRLLNKTDVLSSKLSLTFLILMSWNTDISNTTCVSFHLIVIYSEVFYTSVPGIFSFLSSAVFSSYQGASVAEIKNSFGSRV